MQETNNVIARGERSWVAGTQRQGQAGRFHGMLSCVFGILNHVNVLMSQKVKRKPKSLDKQEDNEGRAHSFGQSFSTHH